MRICRFSRDAGSIRVGALIEASSIIDLTDAGIVTLESVLEMSDPSKEIARLIHPALLRAAASAKLLAPVERQEIWAAGVTYSRSRTARMEESDFSASAYD